jgi:hypothetical protein
LRGKKNSLDSFLSPPFLAATSVPPLPSSFLFFGFLDGNSARGHILPYLTLFLLFFPLFLSEKTVKWGEITLEKILQTLKKKKTNSKKKSKTK